MGDLAAFDGGIAHGDEAKREASQVGERNGATESIRRSLHGTLPNAVS